MAVDRSHHLHELARRDRAKRYDLLRREERYASERTIFQDSVTHAEIWKMTHDPNISRHVYYDLPAWNADGSLLFFLSWRPGRGGRNWLMNADGSNIRELLIEGEVGKVQRPLWSALDPDLLYYASHHADHTSFCTLNVRSGERQELAAVELVHQVEFCPPSSDEKKLLVRGLKNPDRKEWTVYLIDVESGERREVPIQGNIHRLRFNRGADYAVFFNLNDPVEEVRLGSYIVNCDGSGLRELPCGRAGHPDWAFDGHAWSYASEGSIWVMDRDGTNKRQLVDLAAGMHGGWSFDGEWIVSDVTNSGPYANQIILVHTQERGRIHRICYHNASYQGWGAMHPDAESTHPAPVASPDGTKICFDSDMVGLWGNVYVVVARKPDPPTDLQAERVGDAVRLIWKRPVRSKELAGYYIYRSRQSGDGFLPVGREPVISERFEDRPSAGTWFYRVTAVEHSGLEGRPSAEVRVGEGRWTEPVRLYLEPELGRRGGLTDQFDGTASNLYYVELKEQAMQGRVDVDFYLPKAAKYVVWARIAGETGCGLSYRVACNGVALGACEAVTGEWAWVRVLDERGGLVELRLSEGAHTLRFSTREHGVRLDQVLITDDTMYRPTGHVREDTVAPTRVRGVKVETVDPSTLEVTWEPVSDPDLHHYNVYASQDEHFVCSQETLIASPTEPRWLDWGLPSATPYWSATTYYYRVTAVDRAGNESEPSDAAWGRTGVHSWYSLRALERER